MSATTVISQANPPVRSAVSPPKYEWQNPEVENQGDIQGDIWSKGFPKYNETYYLFKIERPTEFARRLRTMLSSEDNRSSLISNMTTVKDQWAEIKKRSKKDGDPEDRLLPVANALIAFTYKGLQTIQSGIGGATDLGLWALENTDPAFTQGMNNDGSLNDPTTDLDPLFAQPDIIHGLLKVAGSSAGEVNRLLEKIQISLGHGEPEENPVITDVPGGEDSSGKDRKGRMVGATREQPNRGKEHFGFQDGISQPLMHGIDDPPPVPDKTALATSTMDTDPSILMVTETTRSQDSNTSRPDWMYSGSFLVFRKLEQNVKAFRDLTTKDFAKYGCLSPDHMGAKLMGRWPSGAPITLPSFHTKDAPQAEHGKVKRMNNFGYEAVDKDDDGTMVNIARGCPLAAHIRKTNPRREVEFDADPNSADVGLRFSKIIRGGIPYGPDYVEGEDPNDGRNNRGLLFACYQGSIEDGFQHMQNAWCNTGHFPRSGSGLDPIIGQPDPRRPGDGKTTTINDGQPPVLIDTPLVTFRGGEYFFAPSLKALKGVLSGQLL